MKVLTCCLSSVSGGAVSYLRHLTPLLAGLFEESNDGHQLQFLAHEEQCELLQDIDERQVRWVTGKRPSGIRRVSWEMRHMPRILEEEQADLLFTPYQIGPHVSGVLQVLMLRNMEPFLCGRYPYSPRSRLRNCLLRHASIGLLRKADRVIAVSGFARDHAIDALGLVPERVRTIYHGRSVEISSEVDAEEDRKSLAGIGVGKNFILTCGSLLPYRRCEDVITAFDKHAGQRDDGVQLVIAGSGSDPRYDKLIRRTIAEARHHDRILPLGHVPCDIMAALYRQCLLCVIATEIEACPNIAIEAMAAGCVIASCGSPPLPEIFSGAAVQFRARDIDHLAECMGRCSDDGQLRETMKDKALKRADEFSWQECANKTYAALVEW